MERPDALPGGYHTIHGYPVIENSCLHLRRSRRRGSVLNGCPWETGEVAEGVLEGVGWKAGEGTSLANITVGERERERKNMNGLPVVKPPAWG